ncbi:MAG TPA: DNA polymerase Y family protein [Gammaproteobacteria bacterium]|nr:DNA polymerase Y family protein [Gammaproteobacteria bacterium]
MARFTAVLPLALPFPGESLTGDIHPGARLDALWLAIVFPQLAVEAVAAEGLGGPLAVMEEVGGRRLIHTATCAAAQQGVTAGMTVAAACALCPELRVMERDVPAEQHGLAALAQWAGQFTSWVSVQPPRALLLEIAGSLSLFGGVEALHRRVREALGHRHHCFSSAIAPTPQAALLLSERGGIPAVTEPEALRAVLGGVPVRALPLAPRTLSRLGKTGVRLLRDLWRLPHDDLARRFGAELTAYLDRLLGRCLEPRQAWVTPPRYAAVVDLPLEVRDTGLILPAADHLLHGLCDFLQARDAAVSTLQLTLYHWRRPPSRLTIGARCGSRHRDDWRKLIEERLKSVRLAAPVIRLRLAAGALHAYTPGRRALFGHAEQEEGDAEWQQLLDQLQARLGADAICGLQTVADHRPEHAWRYCPPAGSPPCSGSPARRPLWLLRQPQRLSGIAGLRLQGDVERIEGGWWDGADSRRDYYHARDPQGRCLWLFRDLRGGGWYVHGLFG